MTDKILKEAFDKMVAIEEGAFDDQYGNTTDRGPNAPKSKPVERVPGSEHDNMMKNLERGAKKRPEVREAGVSVQQGEDIMDGIEEFTDIQDNLFELIERLDSAIRAYQPRQHSYWQSYGLGQLKIIAGSDEYMSSSSDRNISTLINDLKDELGSDEGEREIDDEIERRW